MKALTEANEKGAIPALDIFDMVFEVLYPKNITGDFISCELHGNTVEVSTHDDQDRHHKLTITYGVDNIYDNEVVMAEQQLTGYEIGRKTGDVITLIEQMGLTKREWTLIKDRYPNIINRMDSDYIDAYFEPKED